jgi:hypothetical protein
MYIFQKFIPVSPYFNNPVWANQNNATKYLLNTEINEYFFVNDRVRSIAILFNLYYPNDNAWINVLIVILYLN